MNYKDLQTKMKFNAEEKDKEIEDHKKVFEELQKQKKLYEETNKKYEDLQWEVDNKMGKPTSNVREEVMQKRVAPGNPRSNNAQRSDMEVSNRGNTEDMKVCRKWLNEDKCYNNYCNFKHELTEEMIERGEQNQWMEEQRVAWDSIKYSNLCEAWVSSWNSTCEGKWKQTCTKYHPKICRRDMDGCNDKDCDDFHISVYREDKIKKAQMPQQMYRPKREVCEDWLIKDRCCFRDGCRWDHSLSHDQLARIKKVNHVEVIGATGSGEGVDSDEEDMRLFLTL